MSRLISSPSIFSHVLAAVCRSFLANRLGSNKWIPLPPVAPVVNTSLAMDQLVDEVDSIVRLLVMNTAHPCLYYSYARCIILRKWGYPAKLNIGLHNLQGKNDTEGHCWLSLERGVLFEDKDPHEMYPDMIGERNDVIYWAGLKKEDGKEILRVKK